MDKLTHITQCPPALTSNSSVIDSSPQTQSTSPPVPQLTISSSSTMDGSTLMTSPTALPSVSPQSKVRARRCRPTRATSNNMHITRARFTAAMRELRRLASEMLDLSRSSRNQDDGRWKAFVKQLCVADPIFSRYEKCWPARSYYDERRCDSRFTARIKKTQNYGSGRTQQLKKLGNSKTVQRPTNHRGVVRSQATTSGGPVSVHTRPRNVSPPRSPPHSEFHYLLRGLVPNIEDLLPLFEKSGVRNLTDLRAVAEFRPPHFSVFLRDEMGLNAFQYRKACSALQSLTGGAKLG
ncbi:hypothetical protein BC835DRAFT_1412905 [Cytidiella melzeri]|nr:hypothetical protein BC835DRAFT_1412905 [Cytidiella melzeri]